MVIDNCGFLDGGSQDPVDAPDLYGPSGRIRRIPVSKKQRWQNGLRVAKSSRVAVLSLRV